MSFGQKPLLLRIGLSKLTAANAPIWVEVGGVGVRINGFYGRSFGEGGCHVKSIGGGSSTEAGVV